MAPLSPVFFLFVAIICVLFWMCSSFRTLRLAVLLLANFLFLSHFGIYYPALILVAATADYLVGLALGSLSRERRSVRSLLLIISLLVNLGLLATAKLVPWALNRRYVWIFPLSLSFYCFQSLTYTIDSYRKNCPATRSYLAHLAATSFFASIVAGPINRVSELVRQFESPFRLTRSLGGRAILLIGTGLVKKFLIADFLAENLVNRVFDTPTLYSGAEVLIGVYGYALQLLFDFSGYTDIAIGIGQFFGIDMPDNFDRPYLSKSIREFWTRWHITFSFWLRDYLYFSMGGSRCGRVRTSFNLITTMFLGGLWHGITATFAVWGLLHGTALAVVHYYRSLRGERKTSKWKSIVSGLATFHFVAFAWIFFRASDLPNALAILQRIWSGTFTMANITAPILGVLVLAILLQFVPKSWSDHSFEIFGRAPFYVQGAALAVLVLVIQFLAGQGSAGFVYANF
jgi:D-alanyl-lipoteichoic acid acyltransferase DltB (MBOAT superfamily)